MTSETLTDAALDALLDELERAVLALVESGPASTLGSAITGPLREASGALAAQVSA